MPRFDNADKKWNDTQMRDLKALEKEIHAVTKRVRMEIRPNLGHLVLGVCLNSVAFRLLGSPL